MNGNAPMKLLDVIVRMGGDEFTAAQLAGFVDLQYRRPQYYLRGCRGLGRRGGTFGLVVNLLRALRKLGYVKYRSHRAQMGGIVTTRGFWSLEKRPW